MLKIKLLFVFIVTFIIFITSLSLDFDKTKQNYLINEYYNSTLFLEMQGKIL